MRFDRTGVEKGFMIFLTATGCWVSWSFAELSHCQLRCAWAADRGHLPDQTKSTHADGLQIRVPDAGSISRLRAGGKGIPAGNLKGRTKDLSTHEFRHDGLRCAWYSRCPEKGEAKSGCSVRCLEWSEGLRVPRGKWKSGCRFQLPPGL